MNAVDKKINREKRNIQIKIKFDYWLFKLICYESVNK